jgi:hypothetical protein
MVKPSSGFILFRSDGVDYQATGYSYDALSLGYTAIRWRLPLVKMFGDASYSIWNENLYCALAL